MFHCRLVLLDSVMLGSTNSVGKNGVISTVTYHKKHMAQDCDCSTCTGEVKGIILSSMPIDKQLHATI